TCWESAVWPIWRSKTRGPCTTNSVASPASTRTSARWTRFVPPSPKHAIPVCRRIHLNGGGGAADDKRPLPPTQAEGPLVDGGEAHHPYRRGSGAAQPARRAAHARLSGESRTGTSRDSRLGGDFPATGLLLARKTLPAGLVAKSRKRRRFWRPGKATLPGDKEGLGCAGRLA